MTFYYLISFFLLGLFVLITGHWSVDTVVKDKSYNKKLEINMLVLKAITTISMIFIKVRVNIRFVQTNKCIRYLSYLKFYYSQIVLHIYRHRTEIVHFLCIIDVCF